MTTLPEKPKTIGEILQYLDGIDQGIINPTPEEQAELGALLVAKVDATAEFLSELEFQAERLRVAAAKLAEGKRAILAKVERLHSYMAFHMQTHGFNQLPGEVWRAKLNTSEVVEPLVEPTAEIAIHAPEFVRIKYEWDKTRLKNAIKRGDTIAQAFATLETSHSVVIDANKGRMLK